MYEIHVLPAEAEAVESDERYTLGKRYPITILRRQPKGEEPDYHLAAERASSSWDDFEFDTTRAVVIAPEKINLVQDEILVQALNHALANGGAVVVYAEPINNDE
jgi:hypothetical protein